MKIQLFIGVLLLFCAQCAHWDDFGETTGHPVEVPEAPAETPAEDPLGQEAVDLFTRLRKEAHSAQTQVTGQEGVDFFNRLRKKAADRFQIANMHETVHDKEYKSLISQSECNTAPRGDFYFFEESYFDTLQYILSDPAAEVKKEHKIIFNPKRTRFACAKSSLEPGCTYVCLVGPGSTFSDSDIIKGPPLSKCPNGKTSTGLCAASGGSGGNSGSESFGGSSGFGGSSNVTVESSAGGHSTTLILVVLAFVNLI